MGDSIDSLSSGGSLNLGSAATACNSSTAPLLTAPLKDAPEPRTRRVSLSLQLSALQPTNSSGSLAGMLPTSTTNASGGSGSGSFSSSGFVPSRPGGTPRGMGCDQRTPRGGMLPFATTLPPATPTGRQSQQYQQQQQQHLRLSMPLIPSLVNTPTNGSGSRHGGVSLAPLQLSAHQHDKARSRSFSGHASPSPLYSSSSNSGAGSTADSKLSHWGHTIGSATSTSTAKTASASSGSGISRS
eukprot:14239-Heterococcus_DN1.PRE.1